MELFGNMMTCGIKPDVVSCTALITALAADAQWERAETVIDWMNRSGTAGAFKFARPPLPCCGPHGNVRAGVKPNVRTYTALVTAMGNGRQWQRALVTMERMKHSQPFSGVIEPNAYTYSALIKTMGEQARTSPLAFLGVSLLKGPVSDDSAPADLQGEWKMAEELFGALEAAALGDELASAASMARMGLTIKVSLCDPHCPLTVWIVWMPGERSLNSAWALQGEEAAARESMVQPAEIQLQNLTLAERSSSQGSLGSLEYGAMPTAMAEEVLRSSRYCLPPSHVFSCMQPFLLETR